MDASWVAWSVVLWACCSAADASSTDDVALRTAASRGDERGVRRLLQAGANPNTAGADEATPLMLASHRGSVPVIRLLIWHGADVNAASFALTPLLAAIGAGRAAAVRVLLEHGAKPVLIKGAPEDPMAEACRKSSAAIVSDLLKHGANPNARDSGGTPVLGLVSDPRIAGMLVSAGARVRDPGLFDGSVLHARARCGDTRMVRYWVARDMGVEERDGKGMTALAWAAFGSSGGGGHPATVSCLLGLGSNPNAISSDGRTPLMFVAMCGAQDVISPELEPRLASLARILLRAGADPDVLSATGASALDRAVAARRHDLVCVIAKALGERRARWRRDVLRRH